MKWFDKWFAKKCHQALAEAREDPIGNSTQPIRMKAATLDRSLGDHRQTMNLQIHSASGGYVLEFSRYDRKRDEHDRNLHIITDQQNLGESLAQIITVEMLRN